MDPIDGTRAFIDGVSTWAHAIAVARRGQIEAGVVYLPARDTLYAASCGGGARINGRPLAVPPGTPPTGRRCWQPGPISKHDTGPAGCPC